MFLRRRGDGHGEAHRRRQSRERHGDRRSAEDQEARARQNGLDEDVHRSLARTGILGEEDAAALLAGRRAKFGKRVFGRDRDESRLAVSHALARRLDDRGARAAAADPAFLDRAVRPDQGFRARFRGGDGDRADDGGERERLALGLTQSGLLEHAHYILAR